MTRYEKRLIVALGKLAEAAMTGENVPEATAAATQETLQLVFAT